MKYLKLLLVFLLLGLIGAVVFAFSGLYDIGADAPHTAPVRVWLDLLRESSIESRAEQLEVPKLDDPAMVADGADHYAEMCAGCHLSPGKNNTEIRQGLYPRPPNLTNNHGESPAEQFWVIKHGIKMTAMPAWGSTHSDEAIWAMVAFLRKLPSLSAEQYAALTKGAEHHHDEMEHEHSHELGSGKHHHEENSGRDQDGN
jgi:mono/diheme cytochrome c family protein